MEAGGNVAADSAPADDASVASLASLALGGLATAASVAVSRGGQLVLEEFAGEGVDQGSRWLLFSLSKTITAVALGTLFDEGKASPKSRVAEFVPAFASHGKSGVTLHDVLTHSGGYSELRGIPPKPLIGAERLLDWQDQVNAFCELPGKRLLRGWALYRPFSYGILGAVVEAASGTDFRSYCRERIFEPLGLADTTWGAPKDHAVSLVGQRIPEAEAIAREGILVPAGNAYSTARDVMRLLGMLRGGGMLDGVRILDPQTVALMTRGHHTHMGTGWRTGYGLFVDGRKPVFGRGSLGSPGTFGHSGFTSVQAWHDPAADLTMVALTNSCVTQKAGDARFNRLSDEVHRRFGTPTGPNRGPAAAPKI